jgi:membrane protease subunit (stomatin/prohibitin family)
LRRSEIHNMDADWINAHLDDPVTQEKGDFQATVFLSTDGKHTVSMTASTPEGRNAGIRWAKTKFDQIMEIYGSKQGQAAKEYKRAEDNAGLGQCSKCGASNARSQKGSIYCSAKCWLK